jgi:GntR family transcriptional regulator
MTARLWATVLADLRARMANGEFAERFPSDRELVEHYGVSRHTVREAVRQLAMVERRPRRGGQIRTVAAPLSGLMTTLRALGVRPELSTGLQPTAGAPPQRPADADRDALVIEHVVRADGPTLLLSRLWTREPDTVVALVPALLGLEPIPTRAGTVLPRGALPVVPGTDVTRTLGVPPATALFRLDTLVHSETGRAWHEVYLRADRYPCVLQFVPAGAPTAAADPGQAHRIDSPGGTAQ